MRLDQVLPQRLRAIGPEVVKFGIIGGLNVVVNAVVFNLLLFVPLFANGELKAKVVASAVAIVSSYFMNRHWTYRDRDKSAAHREFVLFVGFNLAGLLIELAVMGVTKYLFGMTSWLALNAAVFIGLALGTIFRFLTYRRFVFTPVPVAATAEPVIVPAQAGAIEQEFEDLLEDELDEALEHQLGRREVNPAPASLS
ncbi:GtrA family protein [Allorhizocola rhizosphaerae]|uniref:GtrA family protein n=1 Tax=Allorhizocola rhizosphaerae TaxID=1872709 RepID=UPI000E3E5DAA|nr:GtrA family protein [Allorhizocola rhizosphaerae]